MKHPLINPDSSHYDSKGKAAIFDFEQVYSVRELMSWAKISKAKYEHPARKAKKQVTADKRKAKTFGDYYDMLDRIARKYPHLAGLSAQKVYEKLGMELEY